MPKIFATYCIAVTIIFVVANYKNYVFKSMFSTTQAANKAASQYHK